MDSDQTSLRGGVNGNDNVTISDSSDEKYKRSIRSPHHSRSPDVLRFSKKSYHPLDRSGSQSRNDDENVDSLKMAQLQDWDIDCETNRNFANKSDDEIGFRHDDSSRSKGLEEERESSVIYSRHADRQDTKYTKDTSRRYLDVVDVDRVHRHEREKGSSREERKEKERKKSRTRDHEKERSRVTDREEDRQMEWDVDEKALNGTESEMTTDREKKHGRERVKDIDRNQHRTANDKITRKTSERDRHRDTEVVDRHRERERDQYRNKEREKERERERSVERVRDRDRARQRDRSLDRARDRRKGDKDSEGKSNDWSSGRDRENERVRDRSDERARDSRREGSIRDREAGRDRSRARYWDVGQNKYDGASGKQDWNAEYKRDGDPHSHDQDGRKYDGTSRLDRSTNSAGDSEDTYKRYCPCKLSLVVVVCAL